MYGKNMYKGGLAEENLTRNDKMYLNIFGCRIGYWEFYYFNSYINTSGYYDNNGKKKGLWKIYNQGWQSYSFLAKKWNKYIHKPKVIKKTFYI